MTNETRRMLNSTLSVFIFFVFEQCGVYSLEGFLTNNSLIIDKGSHSEVTIDLGKIESKYKDFAQTNVQASVKISKKCAFKCTGKLEKIEKTLEPYQLPYHDSKSPRPLAFKPISERSCSNDQ